MIIIEREKAHTLNCNTFKMMYANCEIMSDVILIIPFEVAAY